MPEPFTIKFNYPLEPHSINVQLTAVVRFDSASRIYIISDIKSGSHHHLLPDLKLKKKKGHWVHSDSGLSSTIGTLVGNAIDHKLLSKDSKQNPGSTTK